MMEIDYISGFQRRGYDPFCFFTHKDQIIRYHELYNNGFLSTKTAINVIDSHYAYPYYDKKMDTIIFDTHFFDILRIVTAAMLIGNSDCMKALADLCTADYYLCKDEVFLAKAYSESFARKKELVIQALQASKQERIIDRELRIRQLLFVLIHEQGHGLVTYGKNEIFTPYRIRFQNELERTNSKTEYINSIDLTPIKADLDEIDNSVIELSSDTFEDFDKACIDYSLEFFRVFEKGLKLVNIPESSVCDKREALFYACDQYIKKSKIKILDSKQYENDSIIDGYALNSVLHSILSDEVNTELQIRTTVFAYYSCLLTMNIITCVNACVMNYTVEGYKEEDLVWNRLRLESEVFNDVIKEYAYRKPCGFMIYPSVLDYSANLAKIYQHQYAIFCERVFSVEHPNKTTPYCPCNSPEYGKIYDEVFDNLVVTLEYVL